MHFKLFRAAQKRPASRRINSQAIVTLVCILYRPHLLRIHGTMSCITEPRVFTIRTTAPWRLRRSEEREVKEAIRWAVRALAEEIREAFRGNTGDVDWVVM